MLSLQTSDQQVAQIPSVVANGPLYRSFVDGNKVPFSAETWDNCMELYKEFCDFSRYLDALPVAEWLRDKALTSKLTKKITSTSLSHRTAFFLSNEKYREVAGKHLDDYVFGKDDSVDREIAPLLTSVRVAAFPSKWTFDKYWPLCTKVNRLLAGCDSIYQRTIATLILNDERITSISFLRHCSHPIRFKATERIKKITGSVNPFDLLRAYVANPNLEAHVSLSSLSEEILMRAALSTSQSSFVTPALPPDFSLFESYFHVTPERMVFVVEKTWTAEEGTFVPPPFPECEDLEEIMYEGDIHDLLTRCSLKEVKRISFPVEALKKLHAKELLESYQILKRISEVEIAGTTDIYEEKRGQLVFSGYTVTQIGKYQYSVSLD